MTITASEVEVQVYTYGNVPHGSTCCQCGEQNEVVELDTLNPSEVIWSWVFPDIDLRGQRALLVSIDDDRLTYPYRTRVCSEGCAIRAVKWIEGRVVRAGDIGAALCAAHYGGA